MWPVIILMNARTRQSGFTLIEVLVALAIVAVAMAAAVRAVSLMTTSNGVLRDKSIALLAAESRMAEIKLEGVRRGGANTARCSQGRVEMVCEEVITPTETPAVFRIMIRVHDRSGSGPALARLDSLLGQVEQ